MSPVRIEGSTQTTTPELVARHTRLGEPIPRANATGSATQAPSVLADKVRAVYDANPHARVCINRLLGGTTIDEVLADLASEIRFNDSQIRLLEDQSKKSRGRLARQSHHLLSKRPRLAETRATLDLLRNVADWQRWFANLSGRMKRRRLDVG